MNTAKKELRKELLEKLKMQSERERLQKSRSIQDKLFALENFKKRRNVLFYLPIDGEVNTWEMLGEAKKKGKKTYVPVVLAGGRMIVTELSDISVEMVSGPYGTLQPKSEEIRRIYPEDIDLTLVPGVAFDKQGNRLGRGKGYYDRFLQTLPASCIFIGLAFRFQLIDNLPADPHDIAVHRVLTD